MFKLRSALIGYSGFVGGNINSQQKFKDLYNSKNISDIRGKKYQLIVSAATPSLFWKANLEPEDDWKNIQDLIANLKEVTAKHFVLISTIFVYPNPFQVDEDSLIDSKKLTPYGLHRYRLEQFVIKNFPNHTIVRLPNVFGDGIKKNFIYDLIHNNRLDLTHKDSRMQWYDLKNIWKDISVAIDNNIRIVNFSVEPLKAEKIAKYCLNMQFGTITQKPALNHQMYSKYAHLWGSRSKYLYSAKKTLTELKCFILNHKNKT